MQHSPEDQPLNQFDQPLGAAWTLNTERYNPTLFASFKEALAPYQIRLDVSRFKNHMPLILVGNAQKTIMISAITGDAWKDQYIEMAFGGIGLTLDPDPAGPNTTNLGILAYATDFRQDQRARKPIPDSSGKAIARSQFIFTEAVARTMKHVAGASWFACVDAHSHLVQKTFERQGLDFLNISTAPLFADVIREQQLLDDVPPEDVVVASLDTGDIPRAIALADELRTDIAIAVKTRITSDDGQTSIIHTRLVHGDLTGKTVILYDDMYSSGRTSLEAVNTMLEAGARKIILYATAPIFIDDYYETMQKILRLPQIEAVFTTNTLPLEDRASGTVPVPYINTEQGRKEVQVIDAGPYIAHVAKTLLESPTIAGAREKLGSIIYDLTDPYTLLAERFGIIVEKPYDAAVYREGGEICPLPQRGEIFNEVAAD